MFQLMILVFVVSLAHQLQGQINNDTLGTLTIKWMGVIDNEEQSGGIHGPWGNFHVLVYLPEQICPGSSDKYPQPLVHFVVRGPSKREWDDGDSLSMNVNVFKWRSKDDKVLVFVYESDPSFWIFKRKHDPVFCDVISREATLHPVLFLSRYKTIKTAVKRAFKRGCIAWLKNRLPGDYSNLKPLYRSLPKTLVEFETTY